MKFHFNNFSQTFIFNNESFRDPIPSFLSPSHTRKNVKSIYIFLKSKKTMRRRREESTCLKCNCIAIVVEICSLGTVFLLYNAFSTNVQVDNSTAKCLKSQNKFFPLSRSFFFLSFSEVFELSPNWQMAI